MTENQIDQYLCDAFFWVCLAIGVTFLRMLWQDSVESMDAPKRPEIPLPFNNAPDRPDNPTENKR